MFNPLHSKMNQQLYESTSVMKVATMNIQMVLYIPVKGTVPINNHLRSEVSIILHCQLCYTVVQIKNLFKKHLCHHYEKYGRFPLHKRSHHMVPPNHHFSLLAKEDTGKPMKNVSYILQYVKRHLSG